MPPKNKFSKEEIIEVAFNIAKEEGFNGISIRKVANKVGCSIAPIYVNFNDVDELKYAVVKRVQKLIKDLINEQNTGESFLDIGIASVKFAKEYSVIYKEYILQGNIYIAEKGNEFKDIIISEMKKDAELKDFSDDELRIILMKMKVFQVGLSVLATDNNFIDGLTDDNIIGFLKESAMDAILGMRYRKSNMKI